MTRIVTPEILDTLPPDSADAKHSRRDLRLINLCMGNRRWFRRVLARHLRPRDRVLELGAGEGGLHRAAPAGVTWDALDFAPPPADWPAHATWHRTDLRAFHRWSDYTVVVGNLIFHHLEPAELAGVGAAMQPHVRLILASEPSRTAGSALGFSLLARVIRAHAVTRHDGRVSIAAGFRGDELARALELPPGKWSWRAHHALFGANRLIAWRTL
jgi:hypothetical protein